MKKAIIITSMVIFIVASVIIFTNYHQRNLLMAQMNKDLQSYYYICCPNGNELDIKQVDSDEYKYSISCFPYSITDSTKKENYKLKVNLNQKFTFEKIGLLTGASGANSTTDFPNCLITENHHEFNGFIYIHRKTATMSQQQYKMKEKYMYHSKML